MHTKLFYGLVPEKFQCPICNEYPSDSMCSHIRETHGEAAFKQAVLSAKAQGKSDAEVGNFFGLSISDLDSIIMEANGANVSFGYKAPKVKRWKPMNFKQETTTVWSFKQRGDWATHNGSYRGNWSPYIPRNVILRYSTPGETILDFFVGGGTTAVEANLLGRRCIACDINPAAIDITKQNLEPTLNRQLVDDDLPYSSDTQLHVCDARNLRAIADESIDLICTHPPYADIIKYSHDVQGDLSKLSVDDFIKEISNVAKESLRVLKPGRKCAVLIGDSRKNGHVIPIGFKTIKAFLDAGYVLSELMIKRQHNCKATGFWYKSSIKHNFLLLAHEYLPIFEKPANSELVKTTQNEVRSEQVAECSIDCCENFSTVKNDAESTTVWLLPAEHLEQELKRNIQQRFVRDGQTYIEATLAERSSKCLPDDAELQPLLYVAPPVHIVAQHEVTLYTEQIHQIAQRIREYVVSEGFIVIDTCDIRIDGALYPLAFMIHEKLSALSYIRLKEIVIVVPEGTMAMELKEEKYLKLAHRYLLIYRLR